MEQYSIQIIDGMERIQFFDEHWYKVPVFEWCPSVTKILGDAVNKGIGYQEWLKTVGTNANYVTRKAKESGIRIHECIEDMFKGESIRFDSREKLTKSDWDKLTHFTAWANKYKLKPMYLEAMVFSCEWIPEILKGKTNVKSIAGTADFIGHINGELWLLDWKTGNDVYETSEIQVSTYARMYNENAKKLKLEKVTRCGVVHIGAKVKTWKEDILQAPKVQVTECDIKRDSESFEDIVRLWTRLNGYVTLPEKDYPFELKLEV